MNQRFDYIHGQLDAVARLMEKVDTELKPAIVETADLMIASMLRGGKLLICGNGGSAADAQHFAAEMVGRLERERGALAALALTTDTSILTAIGNDYGYDRVFDRQVEALGAAGDVLVAISTSGRSNNLLLASAAAKVKKMPVIALTGKGGGPLAALADASVIIPNDNPQCIQAAHLAILHIWCALIEEAILSR